MHGTTSLKNTSNLTRTYIWRCEDPFSCVLCSKFFVLFVYFLLSAIMDVRRPIIPAAEHSNVVVIGYIRSDHAHHVQYSTSCLLCGRQETNKKKDSSVQTEPTAAPSELRRYLLSEFIHFIPLNILYCHVNCNSKWLRTVCTDEKSSNNCYFDVQVTVHRDKFL